MVPPGLPLAEGRGAAAVSGPSLRTGGAGAGGPTGCDRRDSDRAGSPAGEAEHGCVPPPELRPSPGAHGSRYPGWVSPAAASLPSALRPAAAGGARCYSGVLLLYLGGARFGEEPWAFLKT